MGGGVKQGWVTVLEIFREDDRQTHAYMSLREERLRLAVEDREMLGRGKKKADKINKEERERMTKTHKISSKYVHEIL